MKTRAKRRHCDQPGLSMVPTDLQGSARFPNPAFEVAKIDPVIGDIGEALVFIPRVQELMELQ
jgi:hypothetical protein